MGETITPNQRGKPGYAGYLSDRVVTIPTLLRDAGYFTAMAGKWHLGEELEQDPSRRGFQESYTMLHGGASHFDDEWMMYANYTPVYRENGVRVHVPEGFYSSEFYTDKLIEYLGECPADRPFAFTHVMDLAATILDASRTAHPGTSYEGRGVEPLLGRSLLPVLTGEETVVHAGDSAASWELFGLRAVRKGDFKLLWMVEPFGTNDWQLYDLAKDPGEMVDLSGQMPELRAEMIAIWQRYSEETGVVLPSVNLFAR